MIAWGQDRRSFSGHLMSFLIVPMARVRGLEAPVAIAWWQGVSDHKRVGEGFYPPKREHVADEQALPRFNAADITNGRYASKS